MLGQRFVDDVHVDLAVAEDDAVHDRLPTDQLPQRLALQLRIRRRQHDDLLFDVRRGLRRPGHFDALGGAQELVRKTRDLRRHGGREEQRLAREGQELADLLDVRDETHVEHAVGFVDDEDLHAVEQQLAALEVVEQAARRRDEDVHAARDLGVLFFIGHAADQQGHVELVVLAVLLEALGDLRREFACRLQDQRARHARLCPAIGQTLDHRQGEPGRLAGARLGDAHDILAAEDDRNGLFLDGSRCGVTGFRDGAEQFGAKAEAFKRHKT